MNFTFNDIFKSEFLENAASISMTDTVLTLLLSFAVGLFIFFIYKKCYAGVMYSSGFGITLIAMTMITALLILAVTSNVILSLGMVGALSIVRFRAAIKEPTEIAFLFWSIAAGIVLAAGFLPLAVFGSLWIGLMMFVFANYKTFDRPYILVLHCDGREAEQAAFVYLKEKTKKMALKSKNVSPGCLELNYEIRLKEEDTEFINALVEIPGVSHAVMVSYNGEYTC